MENTGCTLGQRLTSALLGLGLPYQQVSEIVYGELEAIAKDQAIGDWLSFPDGTTYEMTYKPPLDVAMSGAEIDWENSQVAKPGNLK